jgi:hypothetical protein
MPVFVADLAWRCATGWLWPERFTTATVVCNHPAIQVSI